ncbi:hypothetical protein Tco_0651155 [Tanacetum coccineum]
MLGCSGKGFQIRGRELLSLDGAFMRGQYPGQMLTVVGVDANNGIYPVAYDLFSNSNITFIIDRQKGLLPTIARLFPSAEHRKWEISGIPCKHAFAAIHDMSDNDMDVGTPED